MPTRLTARPKPFYSSHSKKVCIIFSIFLLYSLFLHCTTVAFNTMPTRLTGRPKPFYSSPAERVFGAADKIADCISANYYCISPKYQNLAFYRDPGTTLWKSNIWIECRVLIMYWVLFQDNSFVKWPTFEHLLLVALWFEWIIHCSTANWNNCTNSQINCSTGTRASLACCSFG